MAFSEKVSFVIILLGSNIIYTISAMALLRHVTSGSDDIPTLDCPPGQFVFKIPSGRYRNDDGVDQAIDPGYVCRQCRICPIGAEVIAKCSLFADTVCGECIKEGHVFDEGTKSCQPLYIVEGRLPCDKEEERLKLMTGKTIAGTSPESGNRSQHDGDLSVSTQTVNALFVAAATLFAIVLFSAVVLVIIAGMSAVANRSGKQNKPKGEGKIRKGRNLPTTIPNLLVDAVKDKVDQMKGYKTLVNTGDDEEQQCRKQSCPGNTDRSDKTATLGNVKTGCKHGECLNNV
ncbi:uncharacterized protein [Ptychodera flava]|uniref:uncharacterized protein isoform X1 n=1 Tax=Ptychodera flava TaxID=63121 RepID=UPI00396A1007